MEAQSNHWLPLTEYALRSGMSISTLRRKIKSNTIEFKMEEGRYLIRGDDLSAAKSTVGFASSDAAPSARMPSARPVVGAEGPVATPLLVGDSVLRTSPAVRSEKRADLAEIELLREDFRQMQNDNLLRWKALEARVSGLAKKLEFFSEQIAEARMLVKIFEEKLDQRG